MLNRKTVFVVGAGASQEVGLPTGGKLLDILIKQFRGFNIRGIGAHNQALYNAVNIFCKNKAPNKNIHFFFGLSKDIAIALEQAVSIDNYIDAHSSNEDIVFLCKLFITHTILAEEKKSTLYHDNHTGALFKHSTLNKTWFNRLSGLLNPGIKVESVEEIFDSISFVTFNYDRCIEQYLYLSLPQYFGIDNNRAKQLIESRLNIIHPYGKVGGMPWYLDGTKNSHIPYGYQPDGNQLVEQKDYIKTFTEQLEDDVILESIRQKIENAERIIFLGFGFHSQNMKLLEVNKTNVTDAYFTGKGISVSAEQVVKKLIQNSLNKNIQIEAPNAQTCLELLDEHRMVFVN